MNDNDNDNDDEVKKKEHFKEKKDIRKIIVYEKKNAGIKRKEEFEKRENGTQCLDMITEKY